MKSIIVKIHSFIVFTRMLLFIIILQMRSSINSELLRLISTALARYLEILRIVTMFISQKRLESCRGHLFQDISTPNLVLTLDITYLTLAIASGCQQIIYNAHSSSGRPTHGRPIGCVMCLIA